MFPECVLLLGVVGLLGGLIPPSFWGSLQGVTRCVLQDSDGDKSDDLVVDVSNEVSSGMWESLPWAPPSSDLEENPQHHCGNPPAPLPSHRTPPPPG